MKQNKDCWAGHEAARRTALPLLLGALALLCVFGFTGCGRASQLVGPRQPDAHALPQRCKPTWVEPNTALLQTPEQPDGYKANAVYFVLNDPFIAQMESILAVGDPWPVFCEFGLFDMNEDGTPELLIITHGNNGSGVHLYDLSGPEPVCLKNLWWPWDNDCHGVCIRQTENGRAWRIDGVFGNAFALSYFSELFIPEKDGLHVWQCVRCEDNLPRPGSKRGGSHLIPIMSITPCSGMGRSSLSEGKKEWLLHLMPFWSSGPRTTRMASRRRNSCRRTNTPKARGKRGWQPRFISSFCAAGPKCLSPGSPRTIFTRRIIITTTERVRRLYEAWEERQAG